jgi:peptidoglycan-N-acetylglucosamine deacetylase
MIAAIAITSAAVAAVSGGFAYATLAPACNFWGKIVHRGPDGSTGVALTFDDGPTPGSTERVLNALASANAKATFFVIGENVRRHADLLRRIHDDGHLIANHTFNHPWLAFVRGQRYWAREIRETDDIIASIIGKRPAIFRPPVGTKTWYVTDAAKAQNHTLVTWSRRAVDGIPTTPQRILKRFANIRGGDILLLHDGVDPRQPNRRRTAAGEATAPLVELIRSGGLQPMRLDELLGIPGYQA